jgi:translation initiation factor 1 (eIF-1/SUI1)
MVSPMEVRRELLKELKKALGVGGTLVDGVLELQGAYGDKAVAVLRKKGYDRTKRIET